MIISENKIRLYLRPLGQSASNFQGIILLFFSLAMYSCSPSTPAEYFEYGLDLLGSNRKEDAKEAFLKGFLVKNGRLISKLPPNRIFNLRKIPQTGNLLLLISDKKKSTIKVIDLSGVEDFYLPVPSDKIPKFDPAAGIKKINLLSTSSLVINPVISPNLEFAFYGITGGKKIPSIYYGKFDISNSKKDPEKSQNKSESDLRVVYSHKNLNLKYDLFFWKKSRRFQIGFFDKNRLKTFDPVTGSVGLFKNHRLLSIPYPRIGAFFYVFGGSTWQNWGFLLGGGGAYRFHRLGITETNNKILPVVSTFRGISSYKIIVREDLDQILYWKGGSGIRKRVIASLKQNRQLEVKKNPWKLFPRRLPGPNPGDKSLTLSGCKKETARYFYLLSDNKILLKCNDDYFLSKIDKIMKSARKAKLNEDELSLIVGNNLLIDEKRERFFTIIEGKIYLFPIHLITDPDNFSKRIFYHYKIIDQ